MSGHVRRNTQLKAADSLNTTLHDAAVAQNAQVSDAALKTVPELIPKLQPAKERPADKALRFDAPIVGLDSDASLNAATAQSMLLFAQGNLAWTTQGDSQWTAQHTVSINSGDYRCWASRGVNICFREKYAL